MKLFYCSAVIQGMHTTCLVQALDVTDAEAKFRTHYRHGIEQLYCLEINFGDRLVFGLTGKF
jgi:hypothetical protein